MILPEEIQTAKDRVPISFLFSQMGYPVRGGWALCPFHNDKNPSCKVDDRYQNFRCFSCGENGDHIDLIYHARGHKSLRRAIEELGGSTPISPEERAAMIAKQKKIDDDKRRAEEREQKEIQNIWRESELAMLSPVAAYLNSRMLMPDKSWTLNLRYNEMPYYGFADEGATEKKKLIENCPTMVAAIRLADGTIIGLHRTFLQIGGHGKLLPPGDRKRNSAKMVMGKMGRGAIWLSRYTRKVWIGEGIETTRAAQLYGFAFDNEVGFASAVSLGNLSGAAAESIPHPSSPEKRIPGPVPDMSRPGIVLPRDVDAVGIIQDSDSEPIMTKTSIVRAMKRFRNEGRSIIGVMQAADGKDFADMWLDENKRESAHA
jgi:hypothetical protein